MPRRVAAVLPPLAALLVLACAPASPTPGRTTAPPSPSGAMLPSAVPSALGPASAPPSPSPTPAPPLDLSRITVSTVAFARVGGPAVAIVAVGDGTRRLLVATRDGRVWVVEGDGTTRSTPFLDIRRRVVSGGEQGLLGIAVHPGFPTDPRVFVDYTDARGDTVVSSFLLDPTDPEAADPHSERIVLTVDQPNTNHNGGDLHFGMDGFLYVALGDGGGTGDPRGNGQKLTTLLGKILRIDVDHDDGLRPYSVPSDNPFVGRSGVRPEIWLSGLRNPWRFSFDPENGDLWIGDVGQAAWEEVDVVRSGASGLNLGWNRMEGTHCFQPSRGCDRTGLTMPVAEYGHGPGCSMIGGVVYRGRATPFLDGAYLFTDYCDPAIRAIDASAGGPATITDLGRAAGQPSAFGIDDDGEILLATLDGRIVRLVASLR
jgi:glucose/arabinose dehydrogenase